MNLIRIVFLGLAVLLPTAWTMAQATDKAPADKAAADAPADKKEKKAKKEGGEEKKAAPADKK